MSEIVVILYTVYIVLQKIHPAKEKHYGQLLRIPSDYIFINYCNLFRCLIYVFYDIFKQTMHAWWCHTDNLKVL